jgi:hypothetical protein
MGRRAVALAAALAAGAALPAAGDAATFRTSFLLNQLTPSRVFAQTSFLPFSVPPDLKRSYRYRLGGSTFTGIWVPAAIGRKDATEALTEVAKGVGLGANGAAAIVVDRPLTRAEKGRFEVLADLYRDADVLVVAAGHPACGGITRKAARDVAEGRATRWSQVVAGAGADAIKLRYPADGFGNGVPHLGVRWVGRFNKQRVAYGPAGKPAGDGGVSLAAGGDQAVAAITTWSRVRGLGASVCAVPLGGIAPTDASVASLRYPEAFPVLYAVGRRRDASAFARAQTVVVRREVRAFLRSERCKALLRGQGVLVVGDPLPAPQPPTTTSPVATSPVP